MHIYNNISNRDGAELKTKLRPNILGSHKQVRLHDMAWQFDKYCVAYIVPQRLQFQDTAPQIDHAAPTSQVLYAGDGLSQINVCALARWLHEQKDKQGQAPLVSQNQQKGN